jgi:hypothetical protein
MMDGLHVFFVLICGLDKIANHSYKIIFRQQEVLC